MAKARHVRMSSDSRKWVLSPVLDCPTRGGIHHGPQRTVTSQTPPLVNANLLLATSGAARPVWVSLSLRGCVLLFQIRQRGRRLQADGFALHKCAGVRERNRANNPIFETSSVKGSATRSLKISIIDFISFRFVLARSQGLCNNN